MQEREGGGTNRARRRGHPLSSVCTQRTACWYGGEGGGASSSPKERGGSPPKQVRTPFVRGLIQEMGGNPQDLRSPPPNTRKREGGGGVGDKRRGET